MPEDINWLKRRETALMVELSRVKRQISIIEGTETNVDESIADAVEGEKEPEVKGTKKSIKKK